ncbi:MAG: BON domain-containing protein, partial [Verrucomicrobia subdivision 3 bacterium]|nr:BON domain-containing protein [Limisphaerales bacterium]
TTAVIKGKLLKEPGLSSLSINVDTTDGLVTLSGTVPSHEEVAKAVRLAMETEGVTKVVSTLQVKPGK